MKYVPVDWWFPNRTFCQMDTCKGEVTSTYKRQFKDFQTCWEGSIPLVGWVERSETQPTRTCFAELMAME